MRIGSSNIGMESTRISLLDCQESQRVDFGRECGFTDEP